MKSKTLKIILYLILLFLGLLFFLKSKNIPDNLEILGWSIIIAGIFISKVYSEIKHIKNNSLLDKVQIINSIIIILLIIYFNIIDEFKIIPLLLLIIIECLLEILIQKEIKNNR